MNVEPHAATASLWSSLVEARSRRLGAEGTWAGPVTFDGRGPEGLLTEDGRKVVTLLVRRLPRPVLASRP